MARGVNVLHAVAFTVLGAVCGSLLALNSLGDLNGCTSSLTTPQDLLNAQGLVPISDEKGLTTKTGSSISIAEHESVVAYLLDKLATASSYAKIHVYEMQTDAFGRGELGARPPKPYTELGDKKPSTKCSGGADTLKVVTYNVWNINPPWQARMEHIVSELASRAPHIIALQELRKTASGEPQLDQLVSALKSAGHEYASAYFPLSDGEDEGIAILSTFPITSSTPHKYTGKHSSGRVIGSAEVSIPLCSASDFAPQSMRLRVLTTHLGLSDIGQCEATNELRELVRSGASDVILLGDLNTYFDFEWPMDTLTRPIDSFTVSTSNPCGEVNRRFITSSAQSQGGGSRGKQAPSSVNGQEEEAALLDVFSHVTRDESKRPLSHTFTNLRDSRVQDNSRPDRILVGLRSALMPCSIETFGDKPFTHEGKQVFPSDHRGVMATFMCRAGS